MKRVLVVALLCLPVFGQVTYSGSGTYRGAATYGGVPEPIGMGSGENGYCAAGTTGELTEGTPSWGGSDGVAQLPARCMNTAVASTPTGTHIGGGAATTFTPADSAALLSALSSLQCGDTIELAAGTTYTGKFDFPSVACDGGHWIMVKSSGTGDPMFPAEGVRATPCIAGIANDATNGRNVPGYPDYACASAGRTLSAKLQAPNAANQPAVTFAAGANHYRFVGVEITKYPGVRPGQLVQLSSDGMTAGAHHIIFDRVLIHGEQWTTSSDIYSETQGGIKANNSQWVALVNSWNYDTYCNSACVDSQGFSAGTGGIEDGPFKLYNNLIASAGESFMLGGGGQGPGTPNTKDFEVRANHLFHPLTWMIPIESCSMYVSNPTVKNLGEFKNGVRTLLEGNVFENNWQGCQSDQQGYALVIDPKNQNNKASVTVNFDGTAVVTATAGTFGAGVADAANCPPYGCVLEINQSGRSDDNAVYRFCNGANGCDQSGVAGWPNTQARLTSAPGAGSGVGAYRCIPGDCPSCKVQHMTVRYNEIYNVINGLQINTVKSSHCLDEAAGMDHVSAHDNLLHGLSTEMSNGSDPYSQATAFVVGNGQTQGVIGDLEIKHNTVAVEKGNNNGFGGLGQQVDHTDAQYLPNFTIKDNVSVAPWIISHSSGSIVTKGVNGMSNPGLANSWQTQGCQRTYPAEAPQGIVPAGNLATFTFSPPLSSYFVTVNGQGQTLSASTSSSFTLATAASAGDSITVRDLNTCSWVFAGNLLGTSMAGSGKPQDPYPATNNTNCGPGQNLPCILDESVPEAFCGNFRDWGTGRRGDFQLADSSPYLNSATDAATRPATGKSPGADLTVLGEMTQGAGGTAYYPALTVSTTTLPTGRVGNAYQASLQASAGASPYKRWWLVADEGDPGLCGGNCGTLPAGILIGRGGTVNGPFVVLTASRTSNVSTFTPKQTMVAGTWAPGQSITLSGFVDGSGNQANDSSFNGSCVISASSGSNFSCAQTGVDIASHTVNSASMVSFAPTVSGAFSFWVGVRDGAFQQARSQVSLSIATESGHYVELNWEPSLFADSYNIYRSDGMGFYSKQNEAPIVGTYWSDTAVVSGETYYYFATAQNAAGESGYSNEAEVLVP